MLPKTDIYSEEIERSWRSALYWKDSCARWWIVVYLYLCESVVIVCALDHMI